jgi:hypothetical protein
MIGEVSKRLSIGILGAGGCLVLAACASSKSDGGYPTFASIPAAPTDVRAPAAWRNSVAGVSAAGAKLNAETAPSTFSLNNTEAFAESMRRKLDAGGPPVTDPAVSRAEADAFSRSIRARATPPPSRR